MNLYNWLLILLLTNEGAKTSATGESTSENCMVSLMVPRENFKTICDGNGHYRMDQKLKSVESQLSSLRRMINDINTRVAYTLTRKETYAKDISDRIVLLENQFSSLQSKFTNIKSKDVTNLTNDLLNNRKPLRMATDDSNITEDHFRKHDVARLFEEILQRELAKLTLNIKQDIEQRISMSLKEQQKGTLESILQNDKEYMSSDNAFERSAGNKFRNVEKHVLDQLQSNTSLIDNLFGDDGKISFLRMKSEKQVDQSIDDLNTTSKYFASTIHEVQYKRKFEEIEHDIETLASGLASLHENMFESQDVKNTFQTQTVAMEREILSNIRDEINPLQLDIEYLRNQTIVTSRLLRATIKSQDQLRASIQNLNATFKLKSYYIDVNISELATKMNSLNETLNPNYSDALSIDDALNLLDLENTKAFVDRIKGVWPSVLRNLTNVAAKQEILINVVENHVNSTEDHMKESKLLEKIMLPQKDLNNTVSGVRNCFLTLTVCLLFVLHL